MDADNPSNQNLPLDIVQFHKQFTADLEQFRLKDIESDNEESTDIQEEERPVTPIEMAIKKSPKTILELKELIRKRLHIRDDIPTVTSHDQLELAAALMSETSAIWPEMRQQAPDPFLSSGENKELERRVAINVVTTIEKMFSTYIQKLHEANLKGIFSSSSNISRLKSQLSFEANKSLNILNMRRKLASALRYPETDDDAISEDSFIMKVRERLSERTKERPIGRIARKLQITKMYAEELYRQLEIKDLTDKMPDLDMSLMLNEESPDTMAAAPRHHDAASLYTVSQTPVENEQEESAQNEQQEHAEEDGKLQFRLQKSHSLPQVDTAKLFLEELELTSKEVESGRKKSLECLPIATGQDTYGLVKEALTNATSPRKDLEDLMQKEKSSQKVDGSSTFDELEDMPPLLQALPISQKDRKGPKKNAKKRVENVGEIDLDSVASTISTMKAVNPALAEEERIDELPAQPSVVSKRFTKKNIVRASDVRVSSRRNASQITLKKHQTIYNSFKGELTSADACASALETTNVDGLVATKNEYH